MHTEDIQQTLVLIKPDALLYSLTGFIIERISAVLNPVIAAAKMVKVTRELAEAHYENIKDKPLRIIDKDLWDNQIKPCIQVIDV